MSRYFGVVVHMTEPPGTIEFTKLEKDKRYVAPFRNHSVSKANFCTF